MSARTMILSAKHSVAHQRPTTTTSETGAQAISAWATGSGGASIRCWVQPVGGSRQLQSVADQYLKRDLVLTHRVYLLQKVDYRDGDRLMWGTRPLKIIGGGNPGELDRFFFIDAQETV